MNFPARAFLVGLLALTFVGGSHGARWTTRIEELGSAFAERFSYGFSLSSFPDALEAFTPKCQLAMSALNADPTYAAANAVFQKDIEKLGRKEYVKCAAKYKPCLSSYGPALCCHTDVTTAWQNTTLQGDISALISAGSKALIKEKEYYGVLVWYNELTVTKPKLFISAVNNYTHVFPVFTPGSCNTKANIKALAKYMSTYCKTAYKLKECTFTQDTSMPPRSLQSADTVFHFNRSPADEEDSRQLAAEHSSSSSNDDDSLATVDGGIVRMEKQA